MSGIITQGSAQRALLPCAYHQYGMDYARLKGVHEKIFETMKTDRAFEEFVEYMGLGLAQVKPEGEAMVADYMKETAVKLVTPKVWHTRVVITMEAIANHKGVQFSKKAGSQFANALFQTKETNAAAIFGNATSTSAPYALANGEALISASHTLAGGGTVSNLVTGDIDEATLESAIIQIRNFKDVRGLKILPAPVKILIPSNSIFDVERILKSDLRVNTADNDVNAIKSRGDVSEIVEWVFLNDLDTDMWFLILEGAGGTSPGFVQVVRDGVKMRDHMDDDNLNTVLSTYEWYTFAAVDWRYVIGSVGA